MKFRTKHLLVLIAFSLPIKIFSLANNETINFKFGEFNFEYKKNGQSSSENTPSIIALTTVNFGEVLIYHQILQEKKELHLIRTISDSLVLKPSKTNLDTLLLIHSFLQFNLFNRQRVSASVPYSLMLSKAKGDVIVCEFDYLVNSWVADIRFKNGVITYLSISRFDKVKRIVQDKIGILELKSKKISK